jgi:methylisocitrate lyase
MKKTSFRKLLAQRKTLCMPGVFNAMTARLADSLGFKALYISGAGISNGVLGQPDIGLITLEELAQQVRYITSVVKVPVLVDADTGFGPASKIHKTIRVLEEAGAGAVQIEDQVDQKRCGHLPGKRLVSAQAMAEKIHAACQARKKKDFLIVARTDAKAVEGLENALKRAEIYVKAGADVIFPEALESRKELRLFSQTLTVPLLANMTEFGKTPYFSVQEFEKMGYDLVIFPMTAFRVMMKSAEKYLQILKKTGTQKSFVGQMQTRKELYDLLGYEVSDRLQVRS